MRRLPRLRPAASLLLPLALLSGAAVAQAQSGAQGRAPLDIRSPQLPVTVDEVAILDFTDLPYAPDVVARVFPLPDGGWGVSSGAFAGTIQRFDRAGAPAGTLGREGEGPGEFSGGSLIGITTGDRFWVVDPGNGRVTRFTSPGYELEGSRTLPGRTFFAVPSADSAILVTGFYEGRAVARITLDPSEDALGGRIPETGSMNGRLQAQNAARTSGGEVWSVAMEGGAIDILSSDLRIVEARTFPDEELRRAGSTPAADRGKPPVPQLGGLGVGQDGTLWIAFGVADRRWSPDWTRADGFHARLDTRVLGVDPSTRTILGETRLDEICLLAGGALLSCVDELGLGVRVVELGVGGG